VSTSGGGKDIGGGEMSRNIREKFDEDTLSEQPAIEQVKRYGYTNIHGDRLDPDLIDDCERQSRRDVILEYRLKEKLMEINPHLTEESVIKAMRKITHIPAPTTLEANRIFHRRLISGTSVDQDIRARRRKETVRYIDFDNIENNEFLVVNQLWIRWGKHYCRPDIVIFVNGIPLVVIECKSPVAKKTGVLTAQQQLLRYQEEIPQLFRTNEILIGCNLFGAKYGMIDVALDKYHEWKAKNGDKLPNMADHPTIKQMLSMGMINQQDLSSHPPMQEVLIAGLLKKNNLLDILQNFIVYDYSKEEFKTIKKICRYQQYFAVNKIVKRVTAEAHKRGIIWHWQGSGKSLLMVFTAVKLRRLQEKIGNPIILIVTDRRKLDYQITETFDNCNFPNPIRAKKSTNLYKLLSGSGCTIMTTVQKFHRVLTKPLSEAENIIVMTDEAHRTQYGSFGLNLRKALPNACFFAFTGTPLNKKDRNTYRHFSPPGEKYLDRYDMHQSMEDEATKAIKYESRIANLQVVGKSIDVLLRELFPEKSDKELAEIRRRYATVETIMSADRRIERITMDIVEHYNQRIAPNGFKALIVALDRPTAVKYKKYLDKLIDPKSSTVVITVNNDDPKEWKVQYRRTPKEEDTLTGKDIFQNPSHPLKFIIVCDKLLTGFDAPILQVMYLDQRMKEHTLLQAVARTNRPYGRKEYGLIVDYAGVGRELAKALEIFDEEDLLGMFTVDDFKHELDNIKEFHEKAIAIFKKVNRVSHPQDILQTCMEILKPEDVRADFEMLFRDLARSIDMLMPDPCVDSYLKDFKWLGIIREGARNLYRDDKLSLENCSKKVEALIHAHIKDLGIENLLAPVSITAPDFEEKLAVKGTVKAKASHVEHALAESISTKIGEDPAYYESLQTKLETLIEADRMRRIDDAEYFKGLMDLKEQDENRDRIALEKGLSTEEFSVYGLLGSYGGELYSTDDDKRCAFSKRITKAIKEHLVIDWIEKDDVKKEIRRGIKELLRTVEFPEDKLELLVREIMDVARVQFSDYYGKN
jgi:type I restriction enzyme R subunit